jgi:hypothetical protein
MEGAGDLPAEAAGRAGDERIQAVEFEHVRLLVEMAARYDWRAR